MLFQPAQTDLFQKLPRGITSKFEKWVLATRIVVENLLNLSLAMIKLLRSKV